jgi:hypothetical protein
MLSSNCQHFVHLICSEIYLLHHANYCTNQDVIKEYEVFLKLSFLQDVSRLLDLSRQSITFDSAVDIAACIRALREDSDVHVVRIKNKLNPAFDSGPYGGYRDVAINLRLKTAVTICLGLESHVCELQLLLRPFAELKVITLSPVHLYLLVPMASTN